ncbi:MAG: hypothetical protein SOW32_11390 [Agathobacter sp.]|nr:hypothetical protein [Agathobacter sp.]
MSPLEIISRLCDVIEELSQIVSKQQTIIKQKEIEESEEIEVSIKTIDTLKLLKMEELL